MVRIKNWQYYEYYDDSNNLNEYWPVFSLVPDEDGADGETRVRFENGKTKCVPVSELVRAYQFPDPGRELWQERRGDYRLVTATGERDGLLVEVEVGGDVNAQVHVDDLTPKVRDFTLTRPDFYNKYDRSGQFIPRCPKVHPAASHPDIVYDSRFRSKVVHYSKTKNKELQKEKNRKQSLAYLGEELYESMGFREAKRLRHEREREWAPQCGACGATGCPTWLCRCGGAGTGNALTAALVRSAVRRFRVIDIGDVPSVQFELLTGIKTPSFFNKILAAATGMPDDELAAALAETHRPAFAGGSELRLVETDHIFAISRRLPGQRKPCLDRLPSFFTLDDKPDWDEDGRPNAALRRLSRVELLQFMLHLDNKLKGAKVTQEIVDDARDFEGCFYSIAELKKPDPLDRKYLREAEILRRVTAWGKRRYGIFGRWYPIGGRADP